jgi:hypothetical protein
MRLEKVARRGLSPVALQHSRLQGGAGLFPDPIEGKIKDGFSTGTVNREMWMGRDFRLFTRRERRKNGVNFVRAGELAEQIERPYRAAGARREYSAKRNDDQYSEQGLSWKVSACRAA